MSRQPAATDFFVDVPNVGTFSFARRTLRDELKIAAEYSRLTEGVETPTEWLEYVATWISALKVLTVTAPDGWDIDTMDPLDQDTYGKLGAVHTLLREKEQSFRSGSSKAGQAAGKADRDVDRVLVSPQVQSGAD
jgi:hypothetical protein